MYVFVVDDFDDGSEFVVGRVVIFDDNDVVNFNEVLVGFFN